MDGRTMDEETLTYYGDGDGDGYGEDDGFGGSDDAPFRNGDLASGFGSETGAGRSLESAKDMFGWI